jgi:uncharacterized protein YbcV (DUF1398 family)
MFTVEQIKEKLSRVRTGADFPVLAMNLKSIGVTYYETSLEEGRSVYHNENGDELFGGPNHEPIVIADKVNAEQLKIDIANHQQGKSDYFEISRQCAESGIEKWAVCLTTMTCTYFDKAGNKVWVEHIPDASLQRPSFMLEQIKAVHSKVKSGADFPAYIQEVKALGVSSYQTYVSDGHTDYCNADGSNATWPAKYASLPIAATCDKKQFKANLEAHQTGKTDYLTFINDCARCGIEKWIVSLERMTCTYYDIEGNKILVEEIPAGS